MTKHFRIPAVRAHKKERGGRCFSSVFVCAVMVNNLLMTLMVATSRNSFIGLSFLERSNCEAFSDRNQQNQTRNFTLLYFCTRGPTDLQIYFFLKKFSPETVLHNTAVNFSSTKRVFLLSDPNYPEIRHLYNKLSEVSKQLNCREV